MPRPEKVAAVAEIKERIEGARAVFLAEYAGLSVKQQQELRRGLRDKGAEFKIVKMTLARRAASDLDLDELDELLTGPTGLAFADTDAVSAAKVLKDFASSHDVFAVKGGMLGTDFLTPERIAELAEIAPREVLLAQLAGALKAPLTSMAGLLAALPRGAATVMQQLLEKKQGGEFVAADEASAAAPVEGAEDGAEDVEEVVEEVVQEAADEAADNTDSTSDDADVSEAATPADAAEAEPADATADDAAGETEDADTSAAAEAADTAAEETAEDGEASDGADATDETPVETSEELVTADDTADDDADTTKIDDDTEPAEPVEEETDGDD